MQDLELPELTEEGRQRLEEVARRQGVSRDAAMALLRALVAGGGTMAQFSHPELGGMGQWSQGGMIMVGDMSNQGLKQRVGALCDDLARLLRTGTLFAPSRPAHAQKQGQHQGGMARPGSGPWLDPWWPPELGTPSASGAQNEMRYAYFPAACRLAIQQNGRLSLYDTGGHRITGVSQQQGGGQRLVFSGDGGPVRLEQLRAVSLEDKVPTAPLAPGAMAREPTPAADPGSASGDVLALIERLAELREKGILTEEEFTAKKAELLRRL